MQLIDGPKQCGFEGCPFWRIGTLRNTDEFVVGESDGARNAAVLGPIVLGFAEPADAEDEQFAVAQGQGVGFTVDVAKGEGIKAPSKIRMIGTGLEDVEQASGFFVRFKIGDLLAVFLTLCAVLID